MTRPNIDQELSVRVRELEEQVGTWPPMSRGLSTLQKRLYIQPNQFTDNNEKRCPQVASYF